LVSLQFFGENLWDCVFGELSILVSEGKLRGYGASQEIQELTPGLLFIISYIQNVYQIVRISQTQEEEGKREQRYYLSAWDPRGGFEHTKFFIKVAYFALYS